VEADAAIDRGVNLARLARNADQPAAHRRRPTYQIHPEIVAASERVGTTFETLRQIRFVTQLARRTPPLRKQRAALHY
jgi:hypothetical protein